MMTLFNLLISFACALVGMALGNLMMDYIFSEGFFWRKP